mgnify:CR=1 FL=1
MADPAGAAAAAGAEHNEVHINRAELDDIKEDALMGRFLWKEASIVAVTAVFSILATITVSALTAPDRLTEADVIRVVNERALDRNEIVELMNDKALTRKDKDDIYARLRNLEQQYTRIETKLDLLLSRTASVTDTDK